MRSIWAGAISFGLVVIPVKLYAATEQRDITFRQVHRKDGARIQFRRVCTLDGEEVPYSDIAKGYELPTGDMVVLTDEDLADLPLVTAHRIEVLHFAPSAQVEPIYAAKSYYTEPEPAGTRAYVLFRDALEASGKVAVAKVALRQREALAALRVREGVITLETLLWPDEVRQPDFAFLDEDIEVRSQELKMAASLIDTMTEDFEPDQYHDAYREALEAVVQAKVEGNDIVRPAGLELPETRKQPADLTEILRASVAAVKTERGKADGDKRARSDSGAKAAREEQDAPQGQRMSMGEPIPHWPGGLVALGDHQVFVRSAAHYRSGRARTVRARARGLVAELDRPDGPAPGPAGLRRARPARLRRLTAPPGRPLLDRRPRADRHRADREATARPGAPDRQLPGRRGLRQGRRHPARTDPDADPDLPGPARLAAPAGPAPLPGDEPAAGRRPAVPAATRSCRRNAGSPTSSPPATATQRCSRRPGSPPRSPNWPAATPSTTPPPC